MRVSEIEREGKEELREREREREREGKEELREREGKGETEIIRNRERKA